jgi:hypothetical protein
MPQSLHDAVQKALIVEEDMNNGGEGRTPSRWGLSVTPGAHRHQTPAKGLQAIEIYLEDLCS